MTKGYLPYRDFFDMKGPAFFVIEFLGQFITYGRLGIFIVQWLNLFLLLVILCRIFELFQIKNRFIQVGLMLPIAFIAGFTFEGGNLTEEFSLVPIFICLYLFFAFIENYKKAGQFWQKHIYWLSGICFGFFFGLLLMIRLTNAALIGAMILTVLLLLIISRKTKQILICIGMFFLGLSLVVGPILLFFGIKGLLREMFEAVFVLGVKYTTEKSFIKHVTEVVWGNKSQRVLLLVIPWLIPVIIRWRSWIEKTFVIFGAVFTFVAVASGNNYTHYYTLTIPLVLISEISIVDSFRSTKIWRVVLAVIMIISMLVPQYSFFEGSLRTAREYLFHQEYYNIAWSVQDVANRIPHEDSQSVFCYNLNPSWYTYTDLFPCIKYCGWQNHYIALIPQIYDDLKSIFQSNPPLWLILPKNIGELPDFLEKMIDIDYLQVYSNSEYILFHYSK